MIAQEALSCHILAAEVSQTRGNITAGLSVVGCRTKACTNRSNALRTRRLLVKVEHLGMKPLRGKHT